MKSNYKKLGSYIRQVNNRNRDLAVSNLLGVSITKKFIPSIANIIGTDLSSYKIVKSSQFAYGPVTSRNGEKISIALLEEEKCIISGSYTVFEVIDKDLLDPEYLMMWFKRPEFDRYARYMSYGSVREIFAWEEMCDIELPVPTIEVQREIVQEYNTIQKNIATNEQIIKTLEDTASTIYKEYFVDFNFPDENGKPYKKSGGKMLYNPTLEKEIPENWEVGSLGDVCEIKSGKSAIKKSQTKTELFNVPIFGASNIIGYTDEAIFDSPILITGRVGTHGIIQRVYSNSYPSDNTLVIQCKNYEFVFNSLKKIDFSMIIKGSSNPLITQTDLGNTQLILPDKNEILKFEKLSKNIMRVYDLIFIKVEKLQVISNIFLSKMSAQGGSR